MAAKKVATAAAIKNPNLPRRAVRVDPKINRDWTKNLTGSQRDAYLAIKNLFDSYGLGSLSGKIFDFVKNGYSPDTISILLQESPEYKERFAGNEARRKAGLNVLSPGEYISVENSYRQILKQAGLPIGFYDSNKDFAGFIGNDLSPTELKERADLAVQATALAAPEYKQALRQMGLSDSEMTSYWINQSKSLPFLQKTAATAAIGAEALQNKLTFDKSFAENLATQGVTSQEAAEGYARIAQEFGGLKTLGQIYGQAWDQRLAEQGTFLGDARAVDQRNRLIRTEGANFGGSAGGARGGLAQRGGQV